MSFTNFDQKTIHCKILYIGIPRAGKSETLRAVARQVAPQFNQVGARLSGSDDAVFPFEFLPIGLGKVDEYTINLHLYTLPPVDLFELPAHFLMNGVDAFVFVVNSDRMALLDNHQYLENTQQFFSDCGYPMNDMPKVVQYNRADEGEAIKEADFGMLLNPWRAPQYTTIASQDLGVMDGLCSITSQVLKQLAAV